MLALVVVLTAAPKMDEALSTFAKTYNTTFDRLKSVELSDTETRIRRLGEKGKAFEAELGALRKRQYDANDLLVKAIEKKKQGATEKKVQLVEEATKALLEIDGLAQGALDGVKKLNERLTAAGAPLIDPGPPRDPNARD